MKESEVIELPNHLSDTQKELQIEKTKKKFIGHANSIVLEIKKYMSDTDQVNQKKVFVELLNKTARLYVHIKRQQSSIPETSSMVTKSLFTLAKHTRFYNERATIFESYLKIFSENNDYNSIKICLNKLTLLYLKLYYSEKDSSKQSGYLDSAGNYCAKLLNVEKNDSNNAISTIIRLEKREISTQKFVDVFTNELILSKFTNNKTICYLIGKKLAEISSLSQNLLNNSKIFSFVIKYFELYFKNDQTKSSFNGIINCLKPLPGYPSKFLSLINSLVDLIVDKNSEKSKDLKYHILKTALKENFYVDTLSGPIEKFREALSINKDDIELIDKFVDYLYIEILKIREKSINLNARATGINRKLCLEAIKLYEILLPKSEVELRQNLANCYHILALLYPQSSIQSDEYFSKAESLRSSQINNNKILFEQEFDEEGEEFAAHHLSVRDAKIARTGQSDVGNQIKSANIYITQNSEVLPVEHSSWRNHVTRESNSEGLGL